MLHSLASSGQVWILYSQDTPTLTTLKGVENFFFSISQAQFHNVFEIVSDDLWTCMTDDAVYLRRKF